MITRKRITFSALLVLLAVAVVQAQSPRPMTLIDLLEVPQVGGPQLSPDGSQVLFVLGKADWKANNRVSHIWRIQSDGTGIVQLTNGLRGEQDPAWSPDGTRIAFVARRPDPGGSGGEGESSQIYLLQNSGGEAQPVTRHATSVSSISWSPSGDSIYFLAPDPKSQDEKERDRLKEDVYAFEENYKQTHLWKVSLPDRIEKRLTEGNFSITSYKLSPDGSRIAVVRGPDPLLGNRELGELYIMDASGENSVRLTSNRVAEGNMAISPDNSQVLFTAGANEKFEPYYNSNLFLVPAREGAAPRLVLPDFVPDVESAAWSADGRSILMLCNMGVHDELMELDLTTRRTRQVTSSNRDIGGWTYYPAVAKHIFTASDPTMPAEVHLLGGTETAPVRVTHLTEYVARDFRLPREEKIEWKGADGVTVEGILTYPLDYQAGTRYPLAVYTHGGPQSSDKLAFSPWREYRPILAAKGYAVLRPNYRGSTGYGDAFLRDMVGHYFSQAHQDVMAGVDSLISRGITDPDRLVKFGWSAGGHMTNKIITFTDRFKAASSGAGAANWISMYAQSDVRNNRTPWFGGTPWQPDAPIQVYWDNSPLKDVWKVKTPTLFLVGERAARVPMTQAIEMHRALKSNGVPTRLYLAPREPHGWQELRHELFKMNVELEWFERYAMKRPYTWEKPPGEEGKTRTESDPGR